MMATTPARMTELDTTGSGFTLDTASMSAVALKVTMEIEATMLSFSAFPSMMKSRPESGQQAKNSDQQSGAEKEHDCPLRSGGMDRQKLSRSHPRGP